jgi:hypothetical protein
MSDPRDADLLSQDTHLPAGTTQRRLSIDGGFGTMWGWIAIVAIVAALGLMIGYRQMGTVVNSDTAPNTAPTTTGAVPPGAPSPAEPPH